MEAKKTDNQNAPGTGTAVSNASAAASQTTLNQPAGPHGSKHRPNPKITDK
jgi:hypothetical protein